MEESKVIHEITPLMGKDVLYIADRRKDEFTYPIHNHEVYELNFVEHAPAAVIENERKKEADTLSRIESLESKLKQLKESK